MECFLNFFILCLFCFYLFQILTFFQKLKLENSLNPFDFNSYEEFKNFKVREKLEKFKINIEEEINELNNYLSLYRNTCLLKIPIKLILFNFYFEKKIKKLNNKLNILNNELEQINNYIYKVIDFDLISIQSKIFKKESFYINKKNNLAVPSFSSDIFIINQTRRNKK